MEETTIDVAYGCTLSTVIDYRHFLILVVLGEDRGTYRLTGARGLGIVRGINSSDRLMKNCAILNVEVRADSKTTQGATATVKVFKQYLHFCGIGRTEAEGLASFLTELIQETQACLEDEKTLEERLRLLQKEGSHIKTEEDVKEVLGYLTKNSAEICSKGLSHGDVVPTMTNHTMKTNRALHSTRVLRLLQSHRSKTRPWVLTYDNALSLSVKIFVPRTTSTKEGFSFIIQPSGNIVYSSNEVDDEAVAVREEVRDLILNNLESIALSAA